MKKQSIVLGSIFVVGLLLLVPNVSAVEYNTVCDNDWSEDELRSAILERIEELQEKNPSSRFTFWEDPDGPYEGGLDDYKDFIFLIGWIIMAGQTSFFIAHREFRNAESLLESILHVLYCTDVFVITLTYLGEAFDVVEADYDGL